MQWDVTGPPCAGIGRTWLQLFRTAAGSVYHSTSDTGLDWSPAQPSSLPNPNSKVRRGMQMCLGPRVQTSGFRVQGLGSRV